MWVQFFIQIWLIQSCFYQLRNIHKLKQFISPVGLKKQFLLLFYSIFTIAIFCIKALKENFTAIKLKTHCCGPSSSVESISWKLEINFITLRQFHLCASVTHHQTTFSSIYHWVKFNNSIFCRAGYLSQALQYVIFSINFSVINTLWIHWYFIVSFSLLLAKEQRDRGER